MTRQLSTFRLGWELIRFRPLHFAASAVLWTTIHSIPVILGVLVGRVFDALAGEAAARETAWTAVAIFTAIAIGRNGILWIGDVTWISYWNHQALQLRRNLLAWLLGAPRSRAVPSSPGEAVSTFRDDVDDILEYVENYVDLGGLVVFGVGAIAVMAGIDVGLTVLILLPLFSTALVTQTLGPQIRKRRRVMRVATEAVTGFVGETFAAVQAVKLASSEQPILDEFARLNRIRRGAALRDTFLTELLRSVNTNMATIGTAIVLLVAAGAIRDGTFSVGDLAVFLTYMPRLTGYVAFFGDIIAQHRRTGVAYERIRALSVDATDQVLLDRTPLPLEVDPPTAPVAGRPAEDRLRTLEVRGLTYRYDESGAGIEDVDFTVHAGDFVVITGKIGAGKTTLLRALLGLVPALGDIRWNGERVEDPASFLVPPRSAYTPQVPRLFSETLADNIALGHHVTRERLREAVQLAVLDPDLERLEEGMESMVGARGVKLSGGQVQRSAAARMFATDADLLVFDDLSSALDFDTETELWERLFARRHATCLVVSHRRPALRRATTVLLMDGGRITARGGLDELLATSSLMQDLWASGAAGAREPVEHPSA